MAKVKMLRTVGNSPEFRAEASRAGVSLPEDLENFQEGAEVDVTKEVAEYFASLNLIEAEPVKSLKAVPVTAVKAEKGK